MNYINILRKIVGGAFYYSSNKINQDNLFWKVVFNKKIFIIKI